MEAKVEQLEMKICFTITIHEECIFYAEKKKHYSFYSYIGSQGKTLFFLLLYRLSGKINTIFLAWIDFYFWYKACVCIRFPLKKTLIF